MAKKFRINFKGIVSTVCIGLKTMKCRVPAPNRFALYDLQPTILTVLENVYNHHNMGKNWIKCKFKEKR